METEMKKVNLGSTAEIELPKLDVTKYIGQRARIERIEEYEGKYGYFVKAETAVLDTVGSSDKKIELRASRVFGLQQDANGHVGWGKDTKLGLFLKKMAAPHYRDLVGREVTILTQTSKEGVDFLTF